MGTHSLAVKTFHLSVIKIHPLGTMNTCFKFSANPSCGCFTGSVKTLICWWRQRKLEGITKATGVHPLWTTVVSTQFSGNPLNPLPTLKTSRLNHVLNWASPTIYAKAFTNRATSWNALCKLVVPGSKKGHIKISDTFTLDTHRQNRPPMRAAYLLIPQQDNTPLVPNEIPLRVSSAQTKPSKFARVPLAPWKKKKEKRKKSCSTTASPSLRSCAAGAKETGILGASSAPNAGRTARNWNLCGR